MPQITPLSVLQNPNAKRKIARNHRVSIARAIKAEVDTENTEIEEIEASLNATYAAFEASGAKPLQAQVIRTAANTLGRVATDLTGRSNKAQKRLAKALFHDLKTAHFIAQAERIAALQVKARMLQAQALSSIASSESELDEDMESTLVPVDENGYVQQAAEEELPLIDDGFQAADEEGLDDLLGTDPLQAALGADGEDDLFDPSMAHLASGATADLADYLDEGNMEENRTPDSGTSPLLQASAKKRKSAVQTQGRQARAATANRADHILLGEVIRAAM